MEPKSPVLPPAGSPISLQSDDGIADEDFEKLISLIVTPVRLASTTVLLSPSPPPNYPSLRSAPQDQEQVEEETRKDEEKGRSSSSPSPASPSPRQEGRTRRDRKPSRKQWSQRWETALTTDGAKEKRDASLKSKEATRAAREEDAGRAADDERREEAREAKSYGENSEGRRRSLFVPPKLLRRARGRTKGRLLERRRQRRR